MIINTIIATGDYLDKNNDTVFLIISLLICVLIFLKLTIG